MAYWLVLFYEGKKYSEPTSYNKHLHGFLSDLVITFITLLSTLFPQNLAVTVDHGLHDLPGILPLDEPPAVEHPQNTQPHPMNMTDSQTLAYIQGNIQGKFCKYKWAPSTYSIAQIDVVIKLYLLNERYKCYVEACTDLPTEAIDLNRLWNTDAVEIAKAFIETIWKQHFSAIAEPTYIKIQKTDGQQALQENIKKHTDILYQLIELLRQGMSSQHYLPIVQLLSLAYWLAQYYDKLKQNQDSELWEKYNEHLHYFLTDYVILFIGLLSEAFPNNHCLNEVTRNYVPPNRNDSNFRKTIHYMQETIKVRLEASGYTPSHNSSAQVETAITVYLLCPTYKCHIAACTNLPIEAIKEVTKKNAAKEVAKTFQLIWKERPDFEEEPDYVSILNNVTTYNKKLHTEKHLKIRKQLMELFKRKDNLNSLYLPLVQLLSLAYWLALYYSKLKADPKKYNKTLLGFLSDFVAVFILIISEWYPQEHSFILQSLSDLPGIVETTIEIPNFAENIVFKKLILKVVCQILDITVGDDKTEAIALSIQKHLRKTCKIKNIHWDKRGPDFLYSVIADQARYMTENNNRNTVSYKNISSILKFSVVQLNEVLQGDQQTIKEVGQSMVEHCLQGRLNNSLSEMTDLINGFYHMVFVGIVWSTDENCKDIIKNNLRIEVNKDFKMYIREKACEAIQKAETISDVRESKRFIAKVSVAVREIITTRSWKSIQYHKDGVESDGIHKEHRDVLFHFIAFRVLLMYLLPKDASKYGEKKIAEIPPKYVQKSSIFI